MPDSRPDTELSNPQSAKAPLDPHLKALENESIHIFREVAAEFERPVMLYSIGKDSSVLLHLARKAFYPGRVPFPLLHVNTGWKFSEMIAFRDETAKKYDLDLIEHINPRGKAENITPFTHGSAAFTDIMKTEGLRQALDAGQFDAAFGGARARRGSQPRQGAHLFLPHAGPSLGSAQPAARTLEHLQRHDPQGRERARLPAVELD
ncbi:3'-phosphoadenosine 5'-phosphosulfate sulfotransferase (PAPS reductase)/FAD synthetase [Rhizobium leguminosarum]